MKIAEIILTILKFALEIWKNRTDPEQAKIRAAAQATKELNENEQSFQEALAKNDGAAISLHFEHLRDRVRKATGGSGGNSGQSGN